MTMVAPQKYAVVTPMYRESPEVAIAMMQSVIAQTLPCWHVIVTDGQPRGFDPAVFELYEAKGHRLCLLQLPHGTANSGAAPRALGACWCFSHGIPWVSFLDSDNTLDPNHLSEIDNALRRQADAEAVVTKRRVFLKREGLRTPIEPSEQAGHHFDTNCLTLHTSLSRLLSLWLFWPREFGTGEDRIMSATLRSRRSRIVHLNLETVNYYSEWPIHYKLAGVEVPATAKVPARRAATHFHQESLERILGFKLLAPHQVPEGRLPISPPSRGFWVGSSRETNEAASGAYPMQVHFLGGADTKTKMNGPAKENPVFSAPSDTAPLFTLATCAVLGYHLSYSRVLYFLKGCPPATKTLADRLLKAGARWDGVGVAFALYNAAHGEVAIAFMASTRLAPLWSALAADSRHDISGSVIERLTVVCKQLNLHVTKIELP